MKHIRHTHTGLKCDIFQTTGFFQPKLSLMWNVIKHPQVALCHLCQRSTLDNLKKPKSEWRHERRPAPDADFGLGGLPLKKTPLTHTCIPPSQRQRGPIGALLRKQTKWLRGLSHWPIPRGEVSLSSRGIWRSGQNCTGAQSRLSRGSPGGLGQWECHVA